MSPAPFNPFIFVNGERGREIHLSDKAPTSLVNSSFLGQGEDDSDGGSNRYYKTSGKLPWAIHTTTSFKVPKNGKAINRGYNKFNDWAESGGASFSNWHTNESGNRNTEDLCDQ